MVLEPPPEQAPQGIGATPAQEPSRLSTEETSFPFSLSPCRTPSQTESDRGSTLIGRTSSQDSKTIKPAPQPAQSSKPRPKVRSEPARKRGNTSDTSPGESDG